MARQTHPASGQFSVQSGQKVAGRPGRRGQPDDLAQIQVAGPGQHRVGVSAGRHRRRRATDRAPLLRRVGGGGGGEIGDQRRHVGGTRQRRRRPARRPNRAPATPCRGRRNHSSVSSRPLRLSRSTRSAAGGAPTGGWGAKAKGALAAGQLAGRPEATVGELGDIVGAGDIGFALGLQTSDPAPGQGVGGGVVVQQMAQKEIRPQSPG